MAETISAAEANRKFSALLRGVRQGRTYVVTSHGTPVARLSPVARDAAVAAAAKKALLRRLAAQPVRVVGGRWTRDALYED